MSDHRPALTPKSLSEEFQYVLDRMEHSENNLFITGKAGTGKSTILNLFRTVTRQKIAVLAPTGIAALNVKGQTIHSFFGFPPRVLYRKDLTKRKNHKMFKNVEIIVIDEISMVRADMLDSISYFLRVNREIDEPFGGVKMIFIGDLFQLPPVVASMEEKEHLSRHYQTPYFFSSRVVSEHLELETIELNKVYRQDEMHFIRLLDNIRTMSCDFDDIEDLNARYLGEEESLDYFITLSPKNAVVNKLNKEKLEAIDLPAFYYTAKVTGDFSENQYPTSLSLSLKLGAQVMFIKNDLQNRQFVNGTIGKVVKLNNDLVHVEIEDESGNPKLIEVEPLEWENLKYELSKKTKKLEATIKGTFKQYPLKLAWAITIHKSQGQTFDKVIIDMDTGAFEYGQTYVALSRCRSLSGIYLKRALLPKDIMVDPRIADFYQSNR